MKYSLKKIIPKGIFARSLLIIILPVAIMQIIMVYVFYQRHWESVTRNIAGGVAGEIALIANQAEQASRTSERSHLFDNANIYLDLKARIEKEGRYKKGKKYSKEYEFLAKALEHKIPQPFSINEGDEIILLQVKLESASLVIELPKKRLSNPTTYIFVLLMLGSSFLLVTVAAIFLKNQVRPIVNLAEASEKFGRGLDMPKFKPSGAREVRKAAAAFLVMSKRIKRQVSQRTEMLAAISHDIRSPLTRIKLQLAMLPDGNEVDGMMDDLGQIERTINSYLSFAKGQGGEETSKFSIGSIIAEINASFQRQNKTIEIAMDSAAMEVNLYGRHNEIFRALCNLLDNAFFYGKVVNMTAYCAEDNAFITIEDDGPGIPEDKRREVFTAFHRLDKARDPNKGGVGLGLTIARDVILTHGGNIRLDKSEGLGGLKVEVRLPV